MEIPFYQTEWLGLKLKIITSDLNHNRLHPAGSEFYNAIYKKLLGASKIELPNQWLLKKRTLSEYISNIIIGLGLENPEIISIGCGFGIVEQPLIKAGMKLHLQECQPYSINYLHKYFSKEFEKTLFILSQDLKEIGDNSYDVVMCLTSTYCLDKNTLEDFLASVERILKPNGVFIWYETVLTIDDLIYSLKTLLIKQKNENEVLWGWKRSPLSHKAFAKKHGLHLQYVKFLDNFNHVITPKMALGIPSSNNTAWQIGVYKKHD